MRVCSRCVLPETFPGIRFDAEGVCNFCRSQRKDTHAAKKRALVKQRFAELAAEIRATGHADYQCLLAYSGGKDSTYTLWLLRECYDLRVLAVTFDNGFMSPKAFENIRRMSETLNADSIVVKPRLDLLRRLFAGVLETNPFPPKALERASCCCNACVCLIKNVVMRIALEQRVPLVAYGWTPGQAPISAALFRMNPAMLKQMHRTRTRPLTALAGKALDPYVLKESHFEETRAFPYNVNPMAFHDYTEEEVLEQVADLGWQAPEDTDGNSSNCLLNSFANRAHLAAYKFHPYAWEVSGLVRAGVLPREKGLGSLAHLGTEAAAQETAARLGVEVPPEMGLVGQRLTWE